MSSEPVDADDGLSPADIAALELAVKLTLEEKDRGRVEQVRDMLADPTRSWFETASFCSYHRQAEALHLPVWEHTPSWVTDPDDYPESPKAAQLARRMIAAGVSLYDPDPLRALAAAARKRKRKS